MTSPIKVLVLSQYVKYHTSRPEAEVFIGLADQGAEVHVMSIPNSPYRERLEQSKVHFVPWHPEEKFDKKAVEKIRNYILEHDIQVIQLMNSRAIINGIKAAKGLKVKVVLYRGFAGHIEWYNPASYYKFLNPRVDAIWCNSWGVQQYVKSQSVLVKDKAVIINKGHDPAWYQYEPLDMREELGISKDALVLVTVANNRPMKGVRYLMEAMNHLPEDMDVHLLLAGNDLDNAENRSILAKGTKSGNVHFLGFRDDALNIVAACDLFVLASIKGESITKAVLEAMSLGLGAIISDIPGNVELVDHEHNGLVFPSKNSKALADHIERVYNNRDLIKTYGEKSKERIETVLSNKETIRKVMELYEQLLQE